MTQPPIVSYLSLEGMSACEIHDDIVATLGSDAVPYNSVTRYLREARFPPSKPELHPADVQRDHDDSDQAILAALEESPFASVRQLSRLTHPSTTVYRLLTQPLGFVARHLRWVPHTGSDAQNGERVNLSPQLLRMLEVQHDQAWHGIVILDKSWFYLSTDYEFVWPPRDEIVPERERHTIQSKKFMLTIVWNPHGVPFDQGSRKRWQVQSQLLYR
jgi:hypothetical protein